MLASFIQRCLQICSRAPLRSVESMDDRLNFDFQRFNFNLESERLRSFTNWPLAFIEPRQLAAAGFYYLNKADTVRCIFCGVEVGQWVRGDDPMRDHRMWSPNCRFVKKLPCNNVSLGALNETSTVAETGYDTCGIHGREIGQPNNNKSSASLVQDERYLEQLNIHVKREPDFPKYATVEARMESYRYWPISLKMKPNMLTEAGFFYLGRGDQVMCFHCGLGLKDWEDGDDAWVEHGRWSSRCNYLRLIKGKEFVDEVCGKEKRQSVVVSEDMKNNLVNHGIISSDNSNSVFELQSTESSCQSGVSKSSVRPVQIESLMSEPIIGDERLCKICYTEEIGVVFLPCGHIIACVNCAPSLTKCAVCRTTFLATARVYLS